MKYISIIILSLFCWITIKSQSNCSPPFASATSLPDTIAKICKGDNVSFDASGSFAQSGYNIDKYYWDIDNGNGEDSTSGVTTTFTFNDEGIYSVKLKVKDDNPNERCLSINPIEFVIVVAPTTNFTPIVSSNSICLGDTLSLIANPNLYETQIVNNPHFYIDSGIEIPDLISNCFESTIEVEAFSPNQQLININNFESLNINLEHSYLNDLEISITCPSGKEVTVFNQWTIGDIDLGIPVDDMTSYSQPGTGWDYGWAANSSFGTINSYIQNTQISTLPSGIYESVNSLDSLIGCPLNGAWKLKICDHLAQDNGFVFNWSINFSPSIFPADEIYNVNIGVNADSSSWSSNTNSILSSDGNTITISPTVSGADSSIYTIVNSFGCTNDTTIIISVVEPYEINIDTSVCSGSIYEFPDGTIENDIQSDLINESTFTNQYGCDSTITTILTVNLIDTTVTQSGITLSAHDTTYSYEWVDCNDNNAVLINNNSFAYTPLINGEYAVKITDNYCTEETSCFYVYTGVAIDEETKGKIEFFPNPLIDNLTILFPNSESKISYSIYNLEGRLISKGIENKSSIIKIDFSSFVEGVYFIHLANENSKNIIKVIK